MALSPAVAGLPGAAFRGGYSRLALAAETDDLGAAPRSEGVISAGPRMATKQAGKQSAESAAKQVQPHLSAS